MYRSIVTALAAAALAHAQRPANTSICDFYTTALLKDNNATNQLTLLTLLVNTAVIGNYSPAGGKVPVPGILAQGQTYNGTAVNLLPFFTGALTSTNNGGSAGEAGTNFLDDGGVAPLKLNKPAYGTASNQYMLLTHLYQYFGILLGCTHYAQPGFPAYGGDTSMYNVHKFMALDAYQVQYFITQVALSGASFGVAGPDLEYVGHALEALFGVKCAQPVDIVPGAKPELQAVCVADNCPLAPNATCGAYAAVVYPAAAAANGTSMGGAATTGGVTTTMGGNATASGNGTNMPSMSPIAPGSSKSAAVVGAKIVVGAVVACGVAAALWVL